MTPEDLLVSLFFAVIAAFIVLVIEPKKWSALAMFLLVFGITLL